MAKQKSCWGTIVIEFIGLGLMGNYLFKPFGPTGEKIFGFIVLCFCFRWALLFYRNKTICGGCKKSLPKEASFCPYCGSNRVTTIGELSKQEEEQKQKISFEERSKQEKILRKKAASIRYAALKAATYCSRCDREYNRDFKYCMQCQANTISLTKSKIFEIMKKEFHEIIKVEYDLDLL